MRSTLLCVLFLLNVHFAFSQWTNLDTGISDDLNGVVFFGNNGLVSGKKGLYYTTNGGQGASSWQRFLITDSAENTAVYENTNFTHCYSDPTGSSTSGFVFACGQNTLTKQAVIIKIELPSLKYNILYIGSVNSKLNNITYSTYFKNYAAVGDKGLVVRFDADKVTDIQTIGSDDLSTISFYEDKCKMGTEGKILYFQSFKSPYSFEEILTPGANNKVVAYGSAGINNNTGRTFSVGNKFLYYNLNNDLVYNHTNYFGGSLNARCIAVGSVTEYVGTDHGIYYNAGNYALEWQSTSLNYAINSFWKQISLALVYACGDAGVILKTTNGGGTRVPYVKILDPVVGGCAGNYSQIDALSGSVSTCKWYVDNDQVNTTCTGRLTYLFKTAGIHEVKYTVTNSFGIESTAVKNVFISSVPKIDLPVTISDNILCKSESIDVQIENSEKDVIYILRGEDGIKSYGESEPGTGGTISFKTALISQSGKYYLQAKNANSNCYNTFNDKINIIVEKTQAKFYADLINAKPAESILFYQKAIDAQNYKWDFAPNASPVTSNIGDEKASFSKTGDTKIDLEVWSNNGCYDKIEGKGPFIYNDPQNLGNCWALINDGVDSAWNGYEYEGNNDLAPTKDGFLVSGGFNDQIFDSKTGIKPDFKNKKGSFLTKYDRNGVLKWVVSTEHDPQNRDRDIIYSSVEDHDGNIYISGTHQGTFIDNKGDRLKISPIIGETTNTGYIMKLDKRGKTIWALSFTSVGYLAKKVYIDKENNLVAIGSLISPSRGGQLYLNGVKTDIIKPKYGANIMMKITGAGTISWFNEISISSNNGGGLADLGFDSDNNIYLGGNYESYVIFYSAGYVIPEQTLQGDGGYGSRGFLAKYNKDGILQWKMRSNTKDAFFNEVSIKSFVTDENGNSYITGGNGCENTKAVHFFENSDGTITQKSVGSFYVAKVNSLGKCEWLTGIQYADGGGYKIIKDKDKLHVIGVINGDGSFITGSAQNYAASMINYDFILATYDLAGNLKKITANGDNKNHINVPYLEMFNFFKAEDGSFYLSNNLRGNNYSSFGNSLTTNGIDGTVIHFNEDCGIVKYENTLSTDNFTKTSNTVVYPNPTSGKISVNMQDYSGEVTVQIYDNNGRKLTEKKTSDLAKLDLSINGSQGLYFVKIKSNGKTNLFKVVKQ